MERHLYVFGKVKDIITGETLTETHDERLRQKVAALLLEKGFTRDEIKPRQTLTVKNLGQSVDVMVDWAVEISGKVLMIARFGPGSLVSRQRPALAVSRLLTPYQIPVVMVTNGEDATVLDARSGKVIGGGLDAIPGKTELLELTKNAPFTPISEKRAHMEEKILYTYEALDTCSCGP